MMAALAVAIPVHAQDAAPSSICTDRPTKANATCTVPQGMWQLESDVASTTHDRQGSASSDTLYPVNPTIKYGLGHDSDIELNWAPHVRVRTREDGVYERRAGAGDLIVRFKTRLLATDTASLSLIPYVKAPTARSGIGNDRWEGGMAVPIGITLPAGFSLTLGPQLDALADADGHGHHAALSNLVNLSHPLTARLSVAVEYWRQDNWDTSGVVRQQSADAALVFAVNPALQLDMGINLGLNRQTPDRQFYLGVAHRW
jgi:hypothetical protein